MTSHWKTSQTRFPKKIKKLAEGPPCIPSRASCDTKNMIKYDKTLHKNMIKPCIKCFVAEHPITVANALKQLWRGNTYYCTSYLLIRFWDKEKVLPEHEGDLRPAQRTLADPPGSGWWPSSIFFILDFYWSTYKYKRHLYSRVINQSINHHDGGYLLRVCHSHTPPSISSIKHPKEQLKLRLNAQNCIFCFVNGISRCFFIISRCKTCKSKWQISVMTLVC